MQESGHAGERACRRAGMQESGHAEMQGAGMQVERACRRAGRPSPRDLKEANHE